MIDERGDRILKIDEISKSRPTEKQRVLIFVDIKVLPIPHLQRSERIKAFTPKYIEPEQNVPDNQHADEDTANHCSSFLCHPIACFLIVVCCWAWWFDDDCSVTSLAGKVVCCYMIDKRGDRIPRSAEISIPSDWIPKCAYLFRQQNAAHPFCIQTPENAAVGRSSMK